MSRPARSNDKDVQATLKRRRAFEACRRQIILYRCYLKRFKKATTKLKQKEKQTVAGEKSTAKSHHKRWTQLSAFMLLVYERQRNSYAKVFSEQKTLRDSFAPFVTGTRGHINRKIHTKNTQTTFSTSRHYALERNNIRSLMDDDFRTPFRTGQCRTPIEISRKECEDIKADRSVLKIIRRKDNKIERRKKRNKETSAITR